MLKFSKLALLWCLSLLMAANLTVWLPQANAQTIATANSIGHDFDLGSYTDDQNGNQYVVGFNQSGLGKESHVFAEFNIPANNFPASGNIAVLKMNVDGIAGSTSGLVKLWEYTGTSIPTLMDPDSLWPHQADVYNNPSVYKLVDQKNATTVGSTLTFDITSVAASRVGGTARFLITGPENGDNIVVIQRPFLDEQQAPKADAVQSTVAASKSTVTADGNDSSVVTVTVKNAGGTPVSGKAVSLTQGNGSSSAITATQGTSDASGVATFTVKSMKAETVTYTASVAEDNVTVAQNVNIQFKPGAASANKSTMTASKTNASANGTDSAVITVTLKDANDNLVSGKAVTLTQGSGLSTITPSQGTTDASGNVTFTVKSIKAETVTYTASVPEDTVTVNPTVSVTFDPGAVDAAVSTISASKSTVTADGTDSAVVTVTLKDANGNGISGKAVSLTQGTGSSIITATQGTTSANGIATFTVKSIKAETVTYTAVNTTDNVTLIQTPGITFRPGASSTSKSTVTVSKPNVMADGTDSAVVTVTLKDTNDNLISGKAVTLTQGSGGSTITATQGATDANGVATFTVKSVKAEAVTYTASVAADSVTVTQTVSVTFDPGAVDAASSTVTASKPTVAADDTDSAVVTVTLKDANGNAVSGKAVSLAQGTGSSTITATQGTTDASGAATFTVKSVKAETVTYTAENTTDNVTVTQTAVVTFLPGASSTSKSTVIVSKSNVMANGTDSAFVTVTLKDANDNLVSGKAVTLTQGSGGSTITATQGTTDANGVATFTVKSVKAETVTYAASVAADSVTVSQTVSVTFDPGAVDAASSTVTASKSTVTADGTDSAVVTVTLKDANGNAVIGKAVSLTQGTGSSTVTATQGTTDASGVATFTVKSVKAETVTYTAENTTDNVTLMQTAVVTFLPGAFSVSKSTLSISKPNVTADSTDSAVVTVTLKDANDNLVSGKTVTLTQGTGGSTITATQGTTDVSGVATFTVKSVKAETVTYAASVAADSVTVSQTVSVTFDPGAVDAAVSTITASKPRVTADGTDSAVVTVTLKDVNGNAVSGKAVSLTQGTGSSTITVSQGTTDASGVATFAVKSLEAETVTYTAVDTTDNVTLMQTAGITFQSNNARLSALLLSQGTLTPGLGVENNYSVNVDFSVASIDITPQAAHAASTLTFNENSIPSGRTVTVPLHLGDNTVTIKVTAQDGNVNTYSITVNRAYNNDARLQSLELTPGSLTPVFSSDQMKYTSTVANSVYAVSVMAAVNDSNATLRINGNPVDSGQISAPISLQVGSNSIEVEVTAQNNTTHNTYLIQVLREPNSDARLSLLATAPIVLQPAFHTANTRYAMNVESSVNQLTVNAAVYNPNASLTVTGATYDSAAGTYLMNLLVGSNTMTLKVTAQDGRTQTLYTLVVTRADLDDELNEALRKIAIGYGNGDTWESVTQNVLLPAIQDGASVSWTSSAPNIVSVSGQVNRPVNQDAAVVLTATVEKNGARATRTFLLIVKKANVRVVSEEESRTVPIRVGDGQTDIEQTVIIRKTLSDGTKIDKVNVDPAKTQSALQAALNLKQTSVRIVATDVPDDRADEIAIQVPASAYNGLANSVDLSLETEEANIVLNKHVLAEMMQQGLDLFFRFVPIRQSQQLEQAKQQALTNEQVSREAGNRSVSQIGTPMTIETNYASYETKLVFPLSKLNAPAEASAQEAYLASLYVYVEHSDGDIEVKQGTIERDSEGRIVGLSIHITKFSTFTVLKMDTPAGGSRHRSGTSQPLEVSEPAVPEEPQQLKEPVQYASHTAYITGYEDGTFRPERATTRAELAAMMWRILQSEGGKAESAATASFADVPQNHWAYEAVEALHAKGIMLGTAEGRFEPDRPLTRAEFATLAVRWKQQVGTTQTSFADVTGHWAEKEIGTLVQAGIVNGYEDGLFRPNQGVTRAELVKMLNRLLQRGPLTGVTQATWNDVSADHWAFGEVEEASRTHKYETLLTGGEKLIAE